MCIRDRIREYSKELGLPTWDKQSFACLSSRFVYGETISEEKLGMVEKAEPVSYTHLIHIVKMKMPTTSSDIDNLIIQASLWTVGW